MTEITPHNAFTPAKEVQDIERFAGRVETLNSISSALQSEGSQIVLYGQRGIGKSSVARVLSQLAQNDKAAIDRLTDAPFKEFDYLVVSVTCDDSITSIEKLLVRLLTDEQALAPWIPFRIEQTIKAGTLSGELSVKVIKLGGSSTDSITERQTTVEADITSTFANACSNLISSNVANDGLLILVDELDRISDKSGMASLLKALGPNKVTFAFV